MELRELDLHAAAPAADADPFKVGPITDLGTVQKLLDLRPQFAAATQSEPVDSIRAIDSTPH